MTNRCMRCGVPLYDGFEFCRNCGTPVAYSVPRYQKRSARNPLILSATALVLAVVLVLGLWKPGFFWTLKETLSGNAAVSGEDGELADLLAENPDYNPAPIPISGTPAFSVSPVDGITISAEKNALDRERTFTAVPLTESEMGALFLERSAGDWIPVFSFDFDAGLEDNERLPGELNIELDMKKFGVKKELWPYLKVIRHGDDGSMMFLPTSVTGKGISCMTRQNSILSAVFVGLSIGIPVMAYIERGQDGLRELYRNEIFYEAAFPNEDDLYAEYYITYPKSMARTDSPELKALEDQMRALLERYSLDPDIPLTEAAIKACEKLGSNPEFQGVNIETAAYRLMQKVVNEPDYEYVLATYRNPEWQRLNLWPDSVANVCAQVEEADRYLYGERSFRIPTHAVEVLVLDRWPHGAETFGVAKNLYTASPYIHINAKKTADTQSLLMTMTHELFHVTQSGYVIYDENYYMPFFEATAVVLEREAFEYFIKKEKVDRNEDILTDRISWNLFDKPLMTPSLWENVANTKQYMQEQGYMASFWVEFLRDRYGAGDAFLKLLMEEFASIVGTLDTSVHEALRDQTSSNNTVYCGDFKLFCIKNYESVNKRTQYVLPKPEVISLSAKDMHAEILMPYQAFSTRVRDVAINNKDDKGDVQKYKIMVKSGEPGSLKPTVRFYQNNMFQGSIYDSAMLMLPESTEMTMTIQEIEDYSMTTPGTTMGKGYKYELFLLLPPAAPLVEIDKEEGVLRVTPQGFSLSDDIGAGYDVVVITPEGDELHFPMDYDDFEAEIPLEELESDKKDTEKEEPKYKVYLVEKVEFPDGSLQYGPNGKEYEEDDILRFEDILGSYDMTQTVSGFDTDYLDDIVGQMEGIPGMEDYMEQYDEIMGNVDGTYSGTMVISAYQTGGEIAEVSFIPSTAEYGTTYYRGTWDKGVLHLEPVGEILGGKWDLTFKKSSGEITCEGTSDFDNEMASYSYTLSAVKQNG